MRFYSLQEMGDVLQQLSVEGFERRYAALHLIRVLPFSRDRQPPDTRRAASPTLPCDRWEGPTPVMHANFNRMWFWVHPLRFTGGGGAHTVGRDPTASICFDDNTVSWRHASLSEAEGGLRITDLGSRNGTRIDASLVPTRGCVVATVGNTISFGEVSCTLVDVPGLKDFATRALPSLEGPVLV